MPNTPFVITNPCNDKDWLDIKKKKKKHFKKKYVVWLGPIQYILNQDYKLLTKSWTWFTSCSQSPGPVGKNKT